MRQKPALSALLVIATAAFQASCRYTPAALRTPRVLVGNNGITKEIVYVHAPDSEPGMGYIESIQAYEQDNDREPALAVFDQLGLWRVDLVSGDAQRILNYRGKGRFRTPILIGSEGSSLIAATGGGFSDAAVLDLQGNVLWKMSGGYDEVPVASHMATADLNRDGRPEYYIGTSAGLYCRNRDGDILWRTRHSEEHRLVTVLARAGRVATVVGASPPQFLHVYDHRGNLFSRNRFWRLIDGIVALDVATRPDPLLLVQTPNWLVLFDHNLRVLWQYRIPDKLDASWGINAVVLQAETETLIAVRLRTRSAYRRSIFCLFSLQGDLLYQEILRYGQAISSISTNRGTQLLVADGAGKIVGYTYGAPSP